MCAQKIMSVRVTRPLSTWVSPICYMGTCKDFECHFVWAIYVTSWFFFESGRSKCFLPVELFSAVPLGICRGLLAMHHSSLHMSPDAAHM